MISRLCDPARNILTPIGVNTEPFCDMAGKERRTVGHVARRGRERSGKTPPHGKAQKQTVAKAHGTSTRTFARRPDAEETTYEDVVDELRRGLALQYLKDPGLSLSKIA